MSLRAVIFDYGGVLCFHPSQEQFAAAAAACGLPTDVFVDAFWSNRIPYDEGEVEPRDYWSAVARSARHTFSDELIADLLRREIDFWSRLDHRILAWIEELRKRGWRTGILSNLPRPLGTHLRGLPGFLNHFDHVTFSYEVRAVKPRVAIYEDAIRGLGITGSEALFLDDRPENVEGAQRAGMHSELFVEWEKFAADALGRYGLPAPTHQARDDGKK
jgi:putative hydrolase of the HAD superfamily